MAPNISNLRLSTGSIKSGGRCIVLEGVEGRSYTECIAIGDKVTLRESGGAYVFDRLLAKGAHTVFSRMGIAHRIEGGSVRLSFGANVAGRRSEQDGVRTCGVEEKMQATWTKRRSGGGF